MFFSTNEQFKLHLPEFVADEKTESTNVELGNREGILLIMNVCLSVENAQWPRFSIDASFPRSLNASAVVQFHHFLGGFLANNFNSQQKCAFFAASVSGQLS